MSALLTFPSDFARAQAYHNTPEFMRPSVVPYAVSLEGALSAKECELIKNELMQLPAYTVPECGAVTRECVASRVLDPIEIIARNMNDLYFHFDIDPGQHSWMQTYEPGAKYKRHMDGSPGQTRKLTAVAMLDSPISYRGGRLEMYVTPRSFIVPKTLGTVVVFQHWVEHDVEPVTDGIRRTINMGFWGPPFR